MEKNPDPECKKNPDPGSGSGMNIPDHFSESLETVFWFKKTKFFDADPDPGSGSAFRLGTRDPRWKNSNPGSGIIIPDPQHC
jgi:hypothetical protein